MRGGQIDHNKGKGGDTEDVVSLYQSSKVIVEDNHFEGTNWTSHSSSGIALGDGGGSNNIARRNTLVNIGQVGVYIAGGTNNQILNNTIYGGRVPDRTSGSMSRTTRAARAAGMTSRAIASTSASRTASERLLGGRRLRIGLGLGNDFSAPLSLSKLARSPVSAVRVWPPE